MSHSFLSALPSLPSLVLTNSGGNRARKIKQDPPFLSLKTPTKTSQDKADTGNAWQTTWEQCRVAAHVTKEVAARSRVTIATRSSSLWSVAFRMYIGNVCKRAEGC